MFPQLLLIPAGAALIVWLLLPGDTSHHHHAQQQTQRTAHMDRNNTSTGIVPRQQVPGPLGFAAPAAVLEAARRIRQRVKGRP